MMNYKFIIIKIVEVRWDRNLISTIFYEYEIIKIIFRLCVFIKYVVSSFVEFIR